MFVFVWRYDWCRRLANLKIVSKVADLICIVWQVLTAHCILVVRTACLLPPVVYLVHVIRIPKKLSMNVQLIIYIQPLFLTILEIKNVLKTYFLKHVLIRSVVSSSGGLIVRATASHLPGQEFESQTFDHTHLITRGKSWLINTMPEVVGFLRVLRFPPTGKLTEWVRINSQEKKKIMMIKLPVNVNS